VASPALAGRGSSSETYVLPSAAGSRQLGSPSRFDSPGAASSGEELVTVGGGAEDPDDERPLLALHGPAAGRGPACGREASSAWGSHSSSGEALAASMSLCKPAASFGDLRSWDFQGARGRAMSPSAFKPVAWPAHSVAAASPALTKSAVTPTLCRPEESRATQQPAVSPDASGQHAGFGDAPYSTPKHFPAQSRGGSPIGFPGDVTGHATAAEVITAGLQGRTDMANLSPKSYAELAPAYMAVPAGAQLQSRTSLLQSLCSAQLQTQAQAPHHSEHATMSDGFQTPGRSPHRVHAQPSLEPGLATPSQPSRAALRNRARLQGQLPQVQMQARGHQLGPEVGLMLSASSPVLQPSPALSRAPAERHGQSPSPQAPRMAAESVQQVTVQAQPTQSLQSPSRGALDAGGHEQAKIPSPRLSRAALRNQLRWASVQAPAQQR